MPNPRRRLSVGEEPPKNGVPSMLAHVTEAPREPDVLFGPLTLVALGALAVGARRRKPAGLALGLAALALELWWPSYQRFKRHRLVPNVLARYPDE